MLFGNLSEISLSAFVRAVTGNVRAVVKDSPQSHTDEECAEAVGLLLMQYIDACGGSGVAARVDRKRRALVLGVRARLVDVCQRLVEGGFHADAVPLLAQMGYRNVGSGTELISRKVEQLANKVAFDIKMLERDATGEGKGMTKADFTRERVAIMSHYKMHIDPNVYTAEEYACLVNQFNREMEELRRRTARVGERL